MFYLEGLLGDGDKEFISLARSMCWYHYVNAYSAYFPIILVRYMMGLRG